MSRRWTWLAVLALTGFGLLLAKPNLGGHVEWTADGVFYHAQALEVRGDSREDARREAWSSPIAAALRERFPDRPEFSDPRWIEYSSDIYRRRWTVPVIAAAALPRWGDDTLETVSILAYVALAPLLFLLLVQRFRPEISAAVAAFCMLAGPLQLHSFAPMTDSMGLLLVVLSLLAAYLVLERGWRWLALWLPAMLALAFTREIAVIPLVAVAWVALRGRTPQALALAGSGLVLTLLPTFLFSLDPIDFLAFNFSGFQVPTDSSLGFVVSNYPENLWRMLRIDAESVYFLGGAAAIAALLVLRPRGDHYFELMAAASAGALITLLVSAVYSGLRLELVFLPMVAAGMALAVERYVEWRARPAPVTA